MAIYNKSIEWRSLKSVPDLLISSCGIIKRKQTNIRLKTWSVCGYLKVYVKMNGVWKQESVHRLVCEAFNGQPPTKKHQVNHKNGNKKDNNHVNLEWVTCKQNIRHAIDTGLRSHTKYKILDIWTQEVIGDLNDSQTAAYINVSRSQVSSRVLKKSLINRLQQYRFLVLRENETLPTLEAINTLRAINGLVSYCPITKKEETFISVKEFSIKHNVSISRVNVVTRTKINKIKYIGVKKYGDSTPWNNCEYYFKDIFAEAVLVRSYKTQMDYFYPTVKKLSTTINVNSSLIYDRLKFDEQPLNKYMLLKRFNNLEAWLTQTELDMCLYELGPDLLVKFVEEGKRICCIFGSIASVSHKFNLSCSEIYQLLSVNKTFVLNGLEIRLLGRGDVIGL